MDDKAEKVVIALYGEDYEFFHGDTRRAIYDAADSLTQNGYTVSAAAGVLGSVVRAIESEYGG